MQFKALAIALSLLAAHSNSMAQQTEKNGLPCVAEICIGDGLAELSKIQWTQASNPIKLGNKLQPTSAHALSDDDLRSVKGTFPNPSDAAPYLFERQFDNAALPGLARIGAACQVNELVGSYGANGATPTRVGVSLTPSATDPAKQIWTVTTIEREFPGLMSNEQRSQINTQLKLRYAQFGAFNSNLGSGKPGEGRFIPSGMTRFGFGLSMVRARDEGDRLKMHPACANGSTSSASADKAKAG